MENSIYFYLHWARGQIEFWWAIAEPQLISDAALRLYALTALAALTTMAAIYGYCAKKKVTKLERAALHLEFRGAVPQREESIELRKRALAARAAKALEPFRSPLWKLLIVGITVPTVAFVVITANYNWFDPNGIPFSDLSDKLPQQNADRMMLTYFVLNQLGHGVLFDTLEVFDFDMTAITNNPQNYWFSGVVLLYRTLIGFFVAAFSLGWLQLFSTKYTFRKEIKKEIRRLKSLSLAPIETPLHD